MLVPSAEAVYAVVGNSNELGSGVLYWVDADRIHAQRLKQEVIKSGGTAEVKPVGNSVADFCANNQQNFLDLIFGTNN